MLSSEQIGNYYDDVAAELHKTRMGGQRLFNDAIERPALLRLIEQSKSSGTALDIGCGSGIYARDLALAGLSVEGIDVSGEMVKLARAYCAGLNAQFFIADFSEFARSRKSYDLVLASFVIGYFDDLRLFFSNIERLLANNGVALVSTIHPIRMFSERNNFDGYLLKDYFCAGDYDAVILPTRPTIKQPKRTFGDLCNSAWKAGLQLEQVVEPIPCDGLDEAERRLFYRRNPSVIILKLSRRELHEIP